MVVYNVIAIVLLSAIIIVVYEQYNKLTPSIFDKGDTGKS